MRLSSWLMVAGVLVATHGFDWCYDGAGGQLARYAIDCFLEAVTR